MLRLRLTTTVILLPLAAMLVGSCQRRDYGWTIFDADRECKLIYVGQAPPGARAWRCNTDDLLGIFEDDEGRCWAGAHCPEIYDLPQYHFTDRCELLVANQDANFWPWCPEGPNYRPSSTGPRR